MLNDRMLFWKEEGIRFNLIFNKNFIFEENLTNAEINAKIDKEYTVTNGLYKFNSNGASNDIFISRDQLYDIIDKNYRNYKIIFELYLKIQNDDIIQVAKK